MKLLFDTSVLIASVIQVHPQHKVCARWMDKVQAGEHELYISTHSLAEFYAKLTRIPIRPQIQPEEAGRIVETTTRLAHLVPLSAADYRKVLALLVEQDLGGGIVFDAIIAYAAQKVAIDRLLTLNEAHFKKVWPDGSPKIMAP